MKRKKLSYYLQKKMNNGKPPEEILRNLKLTPEKVRTALAKWRPLVYKP